MSESFPMVVSLLDEETNSLATGKVIYYDVRNLDDSKLSPPVSGTLTESSIEGGIYKTSMSVDFSGNYICYITCSGFLSNTEELVINPENIYDIVKRNTNYNLSVEDVIRTNAVPTSSQIVRNVPLGYTDYIINKVKDDTENDWDNTTISGSIFAHYKSVNDLSPYKMSGPN